MSATDYYCSTPASGSLGAVNVTLTNPDTTTYTLVSGFTYQNPPTFSSISPIAGPVTGGTAVTVNGTGFISGATVDLGGTPCTSVVVLSSTQLTCMTGAHASGLVALTVMNPDTQYFSAPNAFDFVPPPAPSGVTPTSGSALGGTTLTVTGTNFISGATVSIDGVSCPTTFVNSSTLTCVAPSHAAGAVDLKVTNPDSQSTTLSSAYLYLGPPTFTSISPAAGALTGGQNVTITGTGFQAGITTTIGGSTCTPISNTSTQINCTTTSRAAGAVNVVITNTDTQSATGTNAYTYQAAPGFSSIAPTAGALAGGTAVTINGSGFLSRATVVIGGSLCGSLTVVNSGQITCTTSAHAAGAVDVMIANTDSQSNAAGNAAYTYQAAPGFSSIAPTSGFAVGGTAVTINGTGFVAGATVKIGGTTCSAPSVVTATQITCTTGAHAGGATDVIVTNSDTQSNAAGNAAYTYVPAPTFTSVGPSAGVIAGGTAVAINGTGFIAGATVTFGGSACTGVSVTPTVINCTTPVYAVGAVNVVITNPDGQNATGTNAYTYVVTPVYTSISLSMTGTTTAGTCVPFTVNSLDQTANPISPVGDYVLLSVTTGAGNFFTSLDACNRYSQYDKSHVLNGFGGFNFDGPSTVYYFRSESALAPSNVTILVDPGGVPSQSANIVVSSGAASSYFHKSSEVASRILASPITGLTANGSDSSTITVYLKDNFGNPLKNTAITLTASPGGTLALTSLTTNAFGIASTSLTSTSIGPITVWLTAPALSPLTTSATVPFAPVATSRINIAGAPRSPTSWNVNAMPFAVTLSVSPALSGPETLVCRLVKAGTATAFAPCDGGPGTGMTFTPANPGAGLNQGIFYFEAGILNGSVTNIITRPFYLHTSLEGKATCSYSRVPSQYFALAAGALGVPSGVFGPINPLQMPISNFNFDLVYYNAARNRTEAQEIRSLRKDVFVDATNKYILIRRAFPSDGGQCYFKMRKKEYYASSPYKPYRRTSTNCEAVLISKAGAAVCIQDIAGTLSVVRFSEMMRLLPFTRSSTNRYPFSPKLTTVDDNAESILYAPGIKILPD
jgi:hypothetical protein